jgi:hypothetical protein
MWNHSETQLFWVTIGMVRLDGEMVASMLAAKSVCNYIAENFQLIILD